MNSAKIEEQTSGLCCKTSVKEKWNHWYFSKFIGSRPPNKLAISKYIIHFSYDISLQGKHKYCLCANWRLTINIRNMSRHCRHLSWFSLCNCDCKIRVERASAQWMPKLSWEDQLWTRADLGVEILIKWGQDPETFLWRIVAAYETWLYNQ